MHKKRARRSNNNTVSLASSLRFLRQELPESIAVDFSLTPLYEFEKSEEIFKGVAFSPDGTCLLTSLGKKCLVYEPHTSTAVLEIKEGEEVYNYAWYPGMQSSTPGTCCFATVCKGTPVHLWDAYESNKLRASYPVLNAGAEHEWALSCGLTMDQVFAGGSSHVYTWDITRPGAAPTRRIKLARGKMVSCMDFTQQYGIFGTYSGHLAMLDLRTGSALDNSSGGRLFPWGISQVKLLANGDNLVLVGGRRTSGVACFDMRRLDQAVQRFPRARTGNNQRIEFAVLGNELLAYGNGNALDVWSLSTGSRVEQVLLDTRVNGVSAHAREVAVATGTRPSPSSLLLGLSSDDEEEEEEKTLVPLNELRMYKY